MDAPLAVRLTVFPAHTVEEEAEAITVGEDVPTCTDTVPVEDVQEVPTPVTVYTVATVGLTTTAVPVRAPGVHV